MRQPKRSTVYHMFLTEEDLKSINPENIKLAEDYKSYLRAVDRSATTINAYYNDLRIFFIWLNRCRENIAFTDVNKIDFINFQGYAIHDLTWSPARIRRMKSALSSMCKYIALYHAESYPGFKSFVEGVESPPEQNIRTKTVFKKEELIALLDYLVNKGRPDKACMLAMAMCNGRRKIELTHMKVSYFSKENILFDKLYRTPETVRTKGRGRIGKPLTIYTLVDPFQKYLDLWLDYRKEHGITSEWLIPKKTGQGFIDKQLPISTMDSWADTFTNIMGRPFYWHSIRHFFTTTLFEADIPTDIIRDLIGWNSTEMCYRYLDTSAEDRFEKYF